MSKVETKEEKETQTNLSLEKDMEEIIQEIVGFFNTRKTKIEIEQPEKTEDNTVLVEVNFKDSVKITDEEYDELYDLLRNLGFYSMNGVENQVNNFLEYKDWIGVHEFKNNNNDKVTIHYTRVETRGKIKFFIDKIDIEGKP
jgi:CBS domain containing-hemolysin-like protein